MRQLPKNRQEALIGRENQHREHQRTENQRRKTTKQFQTFALKCSLFAAYTNRE